MEYKQYHVFSQRNDKICQYRQQIARLFILDNRNEELFTLKTIMVNQF